MDAVNNLLLHYKKNNPSSRDGFVCLSLFTIQTIVLVDRVHGDVDTELTKDVYLRSVSITVEWALPTCLHFTALASRCSWLQWPGQ